MKNQLNVLLAGLALFCAASFVQAGEGLSVTASSTRSQVHVHHNIELDESPYPQFAVDGVLGTKWESMPGDDQWLLIDAGQVIQMERFFITWEHNYPADYELQLSIDGKNWQTVHSMTDKRHFDNDEIFLQQAVTARFIKLNLIKQRESMGFAVAEVTVNNDYLSDLTAIPVPADSPYRNQQLSPEQRAENLLSLMTFSEKLNMTGGVKRFYVTGLSRFGIPEVLMSDASCGMNAMHQVDGKGVRWYTSFPSTLSLAASWNPDLAVEYGKALGREARARGVGVLLGPGVNIQRISQCGRNFEYMGEDPYLAGQTAAGYVRGMQSQGTIATVKHLIANNQEFLRSLNDVRMSKRALNEIYLPAFKAAAIDAEAGAMMTAYNAFEGSPCGSSQLLMNTIMRGQLAYAGFFMTDWSGYGPVDQLLVSGQNIMMPSNGDLVRYVQRESTTPAKQQEFEQKLDAMLYPMIKTFFKHGLYDRPQHDLSYGRYFDANADVARCVAEEGITLLKNDGILPLQSSQAAANSVTFKASHARNELHWLKDRDVSNRWSSFAMMEPGMWFGICFAQAQQLDSLSFNTTGSDDDYPRGYELYVSDDGVDWGAAVAQGRGATVTTLTGINRTAKFVKLMVTEGANRWWSIHDIQLNGESLVRVEEAPADTKQILLLGEKQLVTWNHGASGSGSGFVSGDQHATYLNSLQSEFGKDKVVYKEHPTDEDIRSAETVIYFLCKMGTEAYTTPFEEPIEEHREINRVAAMNPRTVVVYNTGNGDPLAWLDQSAALLYCYFLGQERGNALAAVLSGRVNPSGKLPFTMEKQFADSSAADYNLIGGQRYFHSHPQIPNIHYPYVNEYKDGIYIGYRWYDAQNVEVRFPFGFGLSYTTFELSDLVVEASGSGLDAKIQLRFTIQNTGTVAGAEVGQVYVQDVACSVDRPLKELKAYQKVFLAPGERKQVSLELDGQDLAFWNEAEDGWKVEPGEFLLHVGSSSRDLPLSASFNIQ